MCCRDLKKIVYRSEGCCGGEDEALWRGGNTTRRGAPEERVRVWGVLSGRGEKCTHAGEVKKEGGRDGGGQY